MTERKPNTTLHENNLEFLRACIDGLIAFHAKWTIGSVRPEVTLVLAVTPSMLFRGDGAAEMGVNLLHQGKRFLALGSGSNWSKGKEICFAVLSPGVGSDDGPIFGQPCQATDIPEIIRSSLKKHLRVKIDHLKKEASWQETLQQKLRQKEENYD